MKTVWIVNHYSAINSKDGWNGRHQSLARHMRARGWNPVLLLAGTDHPAGRSHLREGEKIRIGEEDGVPHVMFAAPEYSGNGRSRMVNMAVFALRILKPGALKGVPRPDVIVGSTVHPAAAFAARMLARRYRTPFVFEIRDVWPEALIHLDQLSESSMVARGMRRVMHSLVRTADLVVSPLPRIADYVTSISPGRPTLWVANGTEGDIPTTSTGERPARDGSTFTLMYLGSLGAAMDVETIVRAASLLSRTLDGRKVVLRVVGDGARRAHLMEFADEHAADVEVRFEDRVPRTSVLAKAAEADCLVHAMHDHAVYQYGISPNKIFDYLLAARPVAFAADAPMNPVEEAKAGRVVPPERPSDLAAALAEIADLTPEERDEMGRRGREHVLANYTYSALAEKLTHGLDQLEGRLA